MRSNLYSAIDLHSNNSYLAIIDADGRKVHQERLKNDLELIRERLEPYRASLVSVAIESTYNWYWLADGLIESGYEVELVNTASVKQYEGLKHTNDRSDAFHLANLKRLGILPTGFIMPREMRAVRDLARKRMQLVQYRTGLMPVTKQSGNTILVNRRLKRSKFIHQTAIEWARHARSNSEWASVYYTAQRDRGKGHYSAIRTLAFKLLRILFRIWKDRSVYDENYYQAALRRAGSPHAV